MEPEIFRIKSVTQFFNTLGWEKPNHPLIGVIDVTRFNNMTEEEIDAYSGVKMTSDLYGIILKDGDCGMMYGRSKYDFEEGVLRFIAPNQIVQSSTHTPSSYGFMIVFHPDLIRNFDLGQSINSYSFFSYSVNEALHLSKKEEDTLIEIADNINEELRGNIDRHSQEVIVTNLQLLLNYSKRFYDRQFITRVNSNSDVIGQIEHLIKEYYETNLQLELGIPSSSYFAEKVNLSTNYLSDLIKKETGRSTKDHIDEYVVELAKTKLVHSNKTINEVAYDLGFNYPHYFSRLFKKKTGKSPNIYRSQFQN